MLKGERTIEFDGEFAADVLVEFLLDVSVCAQWLCMELLGFKYRGKSNPKVRTRKLENLTWSETDFSGFTKKQTNKQKRRTCITGLLASTEMLDLKPPEKLSSQ